MVSGIGLTAYQFSDFTGGTSEDGGVVTEAPATFTSPTPVTDHLQESEATAEYPSYYLRFT